MTNNHTSTTTRPESERGPQDRPSETANAGGKNGLDLSFTQITGGALAAMTAAALGSRLGVAGTITGAALASIIAGVGTSLYTASLRRGRETVKTVWSGKVAGTGTAAAVDVVAETPVWDVPQAPVAEPRPRPRFRWKTMLAVTVAAFAIAAIALTGFEVLSGSALSGGKGTTIGQVSKEGHVKAKPSSKATSDDSPSATKSSSDSSSPEATQSQEPSATASGQPTETSGGQSTEQATEAPTAKSTQQQTNSQQTEAPTSRATSKATSSNGGSGS